VVLGAPLESLGRTVIESITLSVVRSMTLRAPPLPVPPVAKAVCPSGANAMSNGWMPTGIEGRGLSGHWLLVSNTPTELDWPSTYSFSPSGLSASRVGPPGPKAAEVTWPQES
jgi:hypothetical protein